MALACRLAGGPTRHYAALTPVPGLERAKPSSTLSAEEPANVLEMISPEQYQDLFDLSDLGPWASTRPVSLLNVFDASDH